MAVCVTLLVWDQMQIHTQTLTGNSWWLAKQYHALRTISPDSSNAAVGFASRPRQRAIDVRLHDHILLTPARM